MAIQEDRRFIHDLRNSVMVIRNLSDLLEQGKMAEKDRAHAYAIIRAECEKLLQACQKKE